MNNFLLFMGALLVAALGAAFAVPQYIEWDDYRATFEDEASRLLGRRIRVGGRVDLRLLPTPYVQFENLRIAGKDGHFNIPLFKAKSVKMWLSITPLVQGKFQAEQIQLTRPELRLELDKTGTGNWNIGASGTNVEASRFRPSKLALQEVIIVNGTLTLVGPANNPIYAIDKVDGKFSAESLTGPFKFKGTAVNSGIKRSIHFSSSKAVRDGSLRFKSTVSYANTGVRYTLDGKALDYLTSPKIEGDLTATLPPLNNSPAQTNSSDTTGPNGAPVELKARLHASTSQLKLSDLSLSFEQAGRPQRLSGEVLTTWDTDTSDGRSSTRGSFNASWLDLDRIAGAGNDNPGPLPVLVNVVEQLGGLFDEGTASRISLKIDQANLGADTVSNIVLDLAKNNGIVTIETLQAQMPGRAQIQARGQITGSGDKRTFEGELAVHGGNLKQFLGWTQPDCCGAEGNLRDYLLPAAGAGVFTTNSHITLEMGQVSIQDINAEFTGSAVFGAASYRWRGTPALKLNLEIPRLNADRLLPDGIQLSGLMGLVTGKPAPPKTANSLAASKNSRSSQTGTAVPHPSTELGMDKTIKLRIGELVVGSENYQDVLVDLALQNGTLAIPRFRFSSGNNLELDIHGSIANINPAGASFGPLGRGTLRGFVKANKAEGVEFLSRFFHLPAGLAPPQAHRRAVAPLRLAVTMSFGGETNSGPVTTQGSSTAQGSSTPGGGVDLVLAGSARGSQLSIRAWLEGGLAHWYTKPVDISLNATNPKVAELVTQLLPASSASMLSGPANRTASGKFHMTATGIPAQQLRSVANLESKLISTRFDGTFRVSNGRVSNSGVSNGRTSSGGNTNGNTKLALHRLHGKMRVDAVDGAPLLVLSSLNAGLIAPGTPVKGTMNIASFDNTLKLDDIQLVVAGNGLTGSAAISKTPNDRRSVTAQLTSNWLSLRGLLQPVLSHRKNILPRRLATAEDGSGSDGTIGGNATGETASETGLNGGFGGQSGAEPALDQTGSDIWPASSFNFKPFEKIDGSLKLASPKLEISSSLTLANTVLELTAAKGKITLRSFNGAIPGGRLSGKLQLHRARAGARISGTMRIDDGNLEKLFAAAGHVSPPALQSAATQQRPDTARGDTARGDTAGGTPSDNAPNTNTGTPADIPPGPQPVVTGNGSMEVAFSGQALSPRGMIAALTGSGIVKLGAASLRGKNPAAVNQAADAVLDKKAGDDDDLMREELVARFAAGQLNLGPRIIKLKISDGALHAQTFEMQTPRGSVATTNKIDLIRFQLSSKWQIKPIAQISQVTGQPMTVLPPVVVTYAGDLGEIGSLEPRINVGALMRELTVRSMERDVEQLELIRLRDERLVQQEEARRKAEELERARQQALIEAQRLRDRQGLEQSPNQNGDQGTDQGTDQSRDRGADQGDGSGDGQAGFQILPENFAPSLQQQRVPAPTSSPESSSGARTAPNDNAGSAESEQNISPEIAEGTTPDPEANGTDSQPESPRPIQAEKSTKPKWDPFANNGVFAN